MPGTNFLTNHMQSLLLQENCAKVMEKEFGLQCSFPPVQHVAADRQPVQEEALPSTWLKNNSQKNPEHGGRKLGAERQ